MNPRLCPHSRRKFLLSGALLATAAPFALRAALGDDAEDGVVVAKKLVAPPPPKFSAQVLADAKVAVARCRGYQKEFADALATSLDQLGGIGSLVRGKSVTVKLNLTGSNFEKVFGRPVGESFITHPDTAYTVAAQLFKAGARRVRFVESTQRRQLLQETVADAGWDVRAFDGLGKVEWENTRNLGLAKKYAHLKVPSGGYLFSSFDVNHSYEESDVLVSLSKLKNHLTCGVTMAVKNFFGSVPNSLYGDEAPNEEATAGRGPLHNRSEYKGQGLMPGELKSAGPDHAGYRVPRIVADILEARPIHLSITDGITSMKGGEGPWAPETSFISPGVLIVGLNPLSTDAIGTAIMGYDPRAPKGVHPFTFGDNHLLLAAQRGLGVLDPKQIQLFGLPLEQARHPYG